MPFRFPALSITARESQHRRLFSNTAAWREGSKNHYETLQIPIDASPADVKKYFHPSFLPLPLAFPPPKFCTNYKD